MNIKILAIGKLKEKYWSEAINEYSKRLSKYCKLTILGLKEISMPQNASTSEEEKVKKIEAEEILNKIKPTDFVISLEINGISLSSEELSAKLDNIALLGKSNIVFVIGGSLGLDTSISERSNLKLSFLKMTFPHQMIRVFLLEQIYRSFKISKNETYHK